MTAVRLTPKLDVAIWAKPMPGDSLDDLARKLTNAGNQVVRFDHAKNRILVLHLKG